MKIYKLFLVLATLLFSFSCSKDENALVVDPFDTLTINTKNPTLNADGLLLLTGGNLSTPLESDIYNAGVCFSEIPNPTLNGNASSSFGTIMGNSFETSIFGILFGKTYYLKAFVINTETGETKYGNEVTFNQPIELTTSIVKNISVTGFSVDVNVGGILSSNNERGICYSTSQNPTVANNTYEDVTAGAGIFTISPDGGTLSPSFYVSPNTVYYLRSYVNLNGQYYYGNQVSFKTCGYVAGSGGFVFFDKGEASDGWRYLEAAPAKLVNGTITQFRWVSTSCTSNTFLSGIQNTLGSGLTNTAVIKSFCNFTSVGATMATNTSLNGQNDWFLPSIDELKEMHKLKFTNQISFSSQFLMSSSQSSNALCFALNPANGNIFTGSKTGLYDVWQVRRF